jgi:lipopolysaccharide transport system ATP-binding protein
VAALAGAPFGYLRRMLRPPTDEETLWALRHVSFQVGHGEVIGIVGRNGAGKSTLLKVLTRITDPTEGRAVMSGRVGALLEVGTGFHPELTGRENVYLNGAILGMKRHETNRLFDEIVDFSGVEKFIDTPVKRYSSGMYVRLAFAVAAHLNTEILIVDEVLAVGDAAFQRKCLGRMQEIGRNGRTIIFVSHTMTAVQSLCSRVLWLDHGSVLADGETGTIASAYIKATLSAPTERVWYNLDPLLDDEQVRLQQVSITPVGPTEDDAITVETPLAVEIQFWNRMSEADLDLKLYILTEAGQIIFVSIAGQSLGWDREFLKPGLYRGICYIPGNLLNAEQYRLTVRIMRNTSEEVTRKDNALIFNVGDNSASAGYSYGRYVGVVRPLLKWSLEQLSEERIGMQVPIAQP